MKNNKLKNKCISYGNAKSILAKIDHELANEITDDCDYSLYRDDTDKAMLSISRIEPVANLKETPLIKYAVSMEGEVFMMMSQYEYDSYEEIESKITTRS